MLVCISFVRIVFVYIRGGRDRHVNAAHTFCINIIWQCNFRAKCDKYISRWHNARNRNRISPPVTLKCWPFSFCVLIICSTMFPLTGCAYRIQVICIWVIFFIIGTYLYTSSSNNIFFIWWWWKRRRSRSKSRTRERERKRENYDRNVLFIANDNNSKNCCHSVEQHKSISMLYIFWVAVRRFQRVTKPELHFFTALLFFHGGFSKTTFAKLYVTFIERDLNFYTFYICSRAFRTNERRGQKDGKHVCVSVCGYGKSERDLISKRQ